MKITPFTIPAFIALLGAVSLATAQADSPKSRAGAIAAVNAGGHAAPSGGRSGGNIGRNGRSWSHNGGGNYGGGYRGGDGRHRRHGGFDYDSTIVLGGFGSPYYGYGYGYGGYPYAGFGYDDYAYPGYGGAYYSERSQPVYEGSVSEGGGNSSLVAQLQRRLARGGYYHGSIDGIAGSGTRRAIRHYERDHGLPVDGEIDERLLAKIGLV